MKTFDDYRARLAENFVVLDREERRERIVRDLELQAGRLGVRVHRAAVAASGLLDEVPDLVEYPTVVAGHFAPEFLELPEEVLTTTMIHHQHWFPVSDEAGTLRSGFLAVTNVQPEKPEVIGRNAERVLAARLRDARFFWDADRKVPLESRIARLDTILFHKKLGSYRAKAERVERLARWVAEHALESAAAADAAALAGRLAKADLATDMVREFTELQGTMGGIYGRDRGAARAGVEGDLLPLPAGGGGSGGAALARTARRRRHDMGGRVAGRQDRHAGRIVCRRRAADGLTRSVRAAAAGPRRVPDPGGPARADRARRAATSSVRCSTRRRPDTAA